MSCCCCTPYPDRDDILDLLEDYSDLEIAQLLLEVAQRKRDRDVDAMADEAANWQHTPAVVKPPSADEMLQWRGHNIMFDTTEELEEFVDRIREEPYSAETADAYRALAKKDIEEARAGKAHDWMSKLHEAKEALRRKNSK